MVRLHADENFKYYPKRSIRVTVDQEPVRKCIEFDEESGWVRHFDLDIEGHFKWDEVTIDDHIDYTPVFTYSYGVVRSDLTDSERRMIKALRIKREREQDE